MNDTPPDIQRKIRELTLKRSGAERVKMASDMFEAARTLVIASFAPGLGSLELKMKLCERFYGTEIDLGAFSAALHSSARLGR
jgi:hypothetical protein